MSQNPNLVKNSSFEVGLDGYGINRAEYVQAGATQVPYYGMTLDTKEKYHGDASLRIDNPDAGSVRFFSRAFQVDPGKQYVLSFAAKAGIAGQDISLNLETAEGNYGEVGKVVSVGNQWKRYSTGPIHIPNGRSLCKIQVQWGIYQRIQAGTSLWLDAFQVREASDTDYVPRPLELGIVNGLPRQYTQSSQQNYPVRFKVRNNGSAAAVSRISYKVVDEYFDKVVSQGEVKAITASSNSTVERAIANISPKKRGKYVLKAALLDGANRIVDHSEFGFAVIDAVKKAPGQFTDDFSVSTIVNQGAGRPMGPQGESTDFWAFYGSSVDETFDFWAQAGNRWIRSWDFNWSNIEPQPGKYNWTLTDIFVQKAKARGIRVLPTLGDEFILDNNRDLPQWLRDDPNTKLAPRTLDPHQQIVLVSMERWKSYLRAVVGHYKGTITAYEIFNEPNLWLTSEQYVGYLKVAYQIIKEVDPQAKVVAFGSSQDYGGAAIQFLEDSFKQGALQSCDVVSFHPYGARLDWSTPLSAEGMNTQIKELMNRYNGADKGLWVTELYYVNKPGKPGEDENYLGHKIQGHELARRYLLDLGTGVSQSFTVPEFNLWEPFAPQSWAVNNHLYVGNEPSTAFVIDNTLARVFGGAKPLGEVVLTGKNKLYLYSQGATSLAATWSSDWDNAPSALTLRGAVGKVQVLDIMGNPSEQVKSQGRDLVITLTNSPAYLLPTKGTESQFLSLLQASGAGASPVAQAPSKGPWDIAKLSQPPPTYPAPGFESEGVQALFFEGQPYQGKPTRVFAYLGMPAHQPGEQVPGVVLVHGGGGTAFANWVRLWNSRGYAAIAMDTYGTVPNVTDPYAKPPTRHEMGGPNDAFQIDQPIEDQWQYHAISDVLLSAALLRAQPDVDANRIGLLGTSWGGYLTCIAAGIDERFKLAVPVYGAGFLAEDSAWLDNFKAMGPEKTEKWLNLWDPSRYVGAAKMPLLWVDTTNDPAYPMSSLQKTYRLLPASQRNLSVVVRRGHAHGDVSEKPEEIHAFVDAILKGGTPLARITGQKNDDSHATVSFQSPRPMVRAELNFAKDSNPWMSRNWETMPAQLDAANHLASADIPGGTTVYYFNLIDDRGLIISSEHALTAVAK